MQIAILPSDLAAAEAARGEAANDVAAADNPEADHQQYWIDDADSRAQVGAAAAQLAADTPQAVADARAQSGPGAIGLTGLALDNFDREFQQRSDALPEAARPAFAQLVAPYRDHLGASAVNTEAADRLAWRADAYTQSADQWGEAVARSPALLPAAAAALQGTLPHLDPAQSDTLAEYARGKLVQGGVAGSLAQDPAALHEALTRAANDEDGTPEQPLHPLAALMTAPERAHYLEAARIGVLAQQTMQREQTRSLAAQAGPQLLATGEADNVPSRAQLIAHLGEEEGTRVADSLQMDAATGSARGLIAPLSEAEFARLEAQGTGEGNDRAPMLRAITLERQSRAADPMGYAQRGGLYGLTPIVDFNNGPALATELGRRRLASNSIAQDYGTLPAILSNAELAQLADILKKQKSDQQQELLGNLSAGIDDQSLTISTFRSLSSAEPVIALAGFHQTSDASNHHDGAAQWGGSGKLDAAQVILLGNELLQGKADQNNFKMPEERAFLNSFYDVVGNIFSADPGSEAMLYQSSKAAYAGQSDLFLDKSGSLDTSRLYDSVLLSLGGSMPLGKLLASNSASDELPATASSGGFQPPPMSSTQNADGINALSPRRQIAGPDPSIPEVRNPDGSWSPPGNIQTPSDMSDTPEVQNSDGSWTPPGPTKAVRDVGLNTGVIHPVTNLTDDQIFTGKQNPPKFFTSTIDNESKTINVDVKIDYQRTTFLNMLAKRVGDEKFARYIDLANAGVNRYWSRNVTLNGEVWTVRVNAINSSDGMPIDLADPVPEKGDAGTRSRNGYPYWTGTIYYDPDRPFADQYFSLVAAHEIGHAFLTLAFGSEFSWGHEGTSEGFLGGKLRDDAPHPPAKGEIGLMPYYRQDRTLPPKTLEEAWSDLLSRTIASENDVKTLIYVSGRRD